MVVADDEVDALLFGIGYLVDGLDAAVEDDDEFHTLLCRIVHTLCADAITLVIAVGDIVFYVGVKLLQEFVYQCHGGASVHIVVAVYHYAFFPSYGIVESVHGHIHVFHKERVDEVSQLWAEESLCRTLCGNATRHEEPRQYGAHSYFLAKFFCRLLCRRCRLAIVPLEMHSKDICTKLLKIPE